MFSYGAGVWTQIAKYMLYLWAMLPALTRISNFLVHQTEISACQDYAIWDLIYLLLQNFYYNFSQIFLNWKALILKTYSQHLDSGINILVRYVICSVSINSSVHPLVHLALLIISIGTETAFYFSLSISGNTSHLFLT